MKKEDLIKSISDELKIKDIHAKAVLDMLEEGATVPFIARYRKEMTGGLNEDEIRTIEEKYQYLENLEKRKEDVIRLIDEKGLLTKELEVSIKNAIKLVEIEDIYRPFKEKRKTKATEAIKQGLEPLAKTMLTTGYSGNKEEIVKPYLQEDVKTYEDAITGAKYIIAEMVSDNAEIRKKIRERNLKFAKIRSTIKKDAVDENEKFKLYYDALENARYIKPHKTLAMLRGEELKILKVSIELDKEKDLEYLKFKITANKHTLFYEEIKEAIEDSYKRLIAPSIEREIKAELTKIAEDKAIELFGINLKNLLLQPPLKEKVILGVDPAFRTGCKLAVISKTGTYITKGVIYPNEKAKGLEVNEKELEKSKKTVKDLVEKYNCEIIAIGNGTASRETEEFIANTIKEYNLKAKYIIVSEAGASVYSASEVAKKEFPDLEVQERSAISIARRVQDPLSELVKIDPKSIGVGQYQHSVNQTKLKENLNEVVSDAVNKIGVNINTASRELLLYVSGLNKGIVDEIVKYRESLKGSIKTREELKYVKKMGEKTYEQAIGFLRILEPENKLDMTSIHPESYQLTEEILKYLNLTKEEIGTNLIVEKIKQLDKEKLKKDLNIKDEYTLTDILDSLMAPLRDIRENYPQPELREDIRHFEDIKIGDELNGTVSNIVDFGCFVDLGVKYSGLLHISNMFKENEERVHPTEKLQVGDLIKVRVKDIDYIKYKMSLELI